MTDGKRARQGAAGRKAMRRPVSPVTRRKFLELSASAASWAAISAAEARSAFGAAATGKSTARVAIGRCRTYDYAAVKKSLANLFDLLGDVDSLVRGKPVVMKVLAHPPDKVDSVGQFLTYNSHPEVARAAAKLFLERGAAHVTIVDSVFHKDPGSGAFAWVGYDIRSFQSELGEKNVAFINTRNKGSGSRYARMHVGQDAYLYDHFDLNEVYDVESRGGVFVSLAKMKNHQIAGVTLTMKNLFGATPCALYGQDAPNEDSISYRGDSHHDAKPRFPGRNKIEASPMPGDNVPRVIADLARARPIHLAILDGIVVVHGGEGPWNRSPLGIAAPGLLLAGRNAVATDSAAAAIMGYNPEGDHYRFPWPNGCNHLALAAARGVGTNKLDEIEVSGLSLAEATYNLPPMRDETP